MQQLDPVPEEIMARLRRKDQVRIAVVGASNNPEKYGNIIVRNLTAKGYTVLPVNPREAEIAGIRAYSAVSDIPGHVDLVNFVTPPKVSLEVLQGLNPSSIDAVWFQDGSYDESVLAEAKKRFRHVVHGACIMVVTNLLAGQAS